MHRRLAGILLLPLCAGVLLTLGGARAGSDVSVTGQHVARDDSNTDALTLRFVTGNRVRFRAYLPALRVSSPGEVAVSSLGPAPLDEEQQRRRRESDGGGDTQGLGGPVKSILQADESLDEPLERTVTGPGDLRLGLAARLVGNATSLNVLDAELTVKLPTADRDDGLGTGEWDGRFGLSGERRFWLATAFGGVGWNRLGDPDWIDFRNPVDLYAGVESEPLGPGVMVSGWVEGNTEVVPGAGERAVLGVGVRSARKRAWQLAATVGLTDAAEEFGLRLGFTLGSLKRRSRALEVMR